MAIELATVGFRFIKGEDKVLLLGGPPLTDGVDLGCLTFKRGGLDPNTSGVSDSWEPSGGTTVSPGGDASIFSFAPRLRSGLQAKVSTCEVDGVSVGVLLLYLAVSNSKWYSGSCKSVRASRVRDKEEHFLPIVDSQNEGLAFSMATIGLPDGLTDREADRLHSPMALGFRGPSARGLPKKHTVRFLLYRTIENAKQIREDENGPVRLWGMGDEIETCVETEAAGTGRWDPVYRGRKYRIRFVDWDQPELFEHGKWIPVQVSGRRMRLQRFDGEPDVRVH